MSTVTQTVERSILLDADRERVWEAITEPGLLEQWLADEVELDLRVGGEIVCRYEDGEERRGEVKLVEEAERLAFRWHRDGGRPSTVELTLVAVAGGTAVTVAETGRVGPLLSAAGWGARLQALRLPVGRLVLA